ncbi:MAG: cellulase family glycosylhydrolase [Chloroflexi bacterium]|nr:cellulase family glycosylhydrolase [Chloroflexota bacterium]
MIVARAGLAVAALALLAVLWKTSNQAIPRPVNASSPANSVQAAIDLPADGSTLQGPSYVVGWAVDSASSSGVGIDHVSVFLDGTYVGDAHLGLSRDDIAAAYGKNFQMAGWQMMLDLDSLTVPGQHHVEIRVRSAVNGAETSLTRTLSITGPQQFCVNDHPLRFDMETAAASMAEVRAGGMSMMRIDVSWAALEPDAPGVWSAPYLARLDDVLQLAQDRGVRPILVVVSTPAWARGSTGSQMTPPAQPSAFGDFMGRLAAHYTNRAGMVYEVWNEPNQHQFWDALGGPDPATYTALLRASYQSIKSAAPSAVILGGSIAFNDPAFLQGMYAAGASGAFDGLALHPYSGTNPPDAVEDPSRSFVGAIDQAQDILSAHGDANKPIWITEMGWSQNDVSDEVRATYMASAVNLVRSRSSIAAFCAYTLDQQADDAAYGLIGSGGQPTRSWLSYVQAIAKR